MRRSLKQPVIFDGRNLFEPELMKQLGIEYHGIGRAAPG
jgi:UDPglucose 6-dehydrogenase